MEHELCIDGHKLVAFGFNEDKSGTPVIFLHGISSSPRFWTTAQMPPFRDDFRWYALTLPGHYPAAFPEGFRRADLTADMIVRVLGEAIQQLVGNQSVLLFGYSTGGFAALDIAAHWPELVKAVICVSGFAEGKWTGVLGLMQRLARRGPVGEVLFRLNMRTSSLTPGIYRFMARFYAADARALYAYPDTRAAIDAGYRDALHLNTHAMAHWFNRMPDVDITPLLPRISAPVLALAGDRDPIVPPAQARLIAERVQRGTLVLLPGAGHLPMAELPADYAKAITEWMQTESGVLQSGI
jgi:pimeloyl-ACP methyl ester carboxylesterase